MAVPAVVVFVGFDIALDNVVDVAAAAADVAVHVRQVSWFLILTELSLRPARFLFLRMVLMGAFP
jgi:hypothetical protein